MSLYGTEQKRLNDVILWELGLEHGWCRAEGVIEQNSGATAALPVGQVLQAGEETLGTFPHPSYGVCTTGANATAILLEAVSLAAHKAGDVTVPVLFRGPALIIEDGITISGAQKAAALSALADLDIETRKHPVKEETGTGTY